MRNAILRNHLKYVSNKDYVTFLIKLSALLSYEIKQCLCIFSCVSVWTVASETFINVAMHCEELPWKTLYGLSCTFIKPGDICLEFSLLFTPTSFCIVQYCEMDFNNIAQCSSASLERCNDVPGLCFVVKSRKPILQFCFALTEGFSYGRSCSNTLTSYHSSTSCAIHQSLWTIHGCSTWDQGNARLKDIHHCT